MGYRLTQQDIDEAIARKTGTPPSIPSEISKPEENAYQKGLRASFAENPISSHLIAGTEKSLLDTLQNVSNFPHDVAEGLGFNVGERIKFPESLNLENYLSNGGTGANVANIAGKILPYILPTKLGLKALESAPLLAKVLGGAAIGSAVSSGETPGGRLVGGAIGAAVPALTSLGNKNIANKLTEAFDATRNIFSQKYGKVFKEVENLPTKFKAVKLPKELDYLTGETPTEAMRVLQKETGSLKYVDELRRKPSFQNAHDAQSELGQVIYDIKNNPKSYINPRRVGKIAADLQDKIKEGMHQYLVKRGRPELSKEYSQISDEYRELAAPFRNIVIKNKNVFDLYKEGKIGKSELVNKVLKSTDFHKSVPGKKMTEFQIRKSIDDVLKSSAFKHAAAGTAILGIPSAYYEFHNKD